MRFSTVAAGHVLGAALSVSGVGCSQSNPGPALTISPSGTVAVTGPTAFTAELVNSTADVTWTVTGGGTLSDTTGLHVSYAPPPGTATATLTAAAAAVGLTASVQIASAPAVLTGSVIPTLTAPVTVLYDAEDIPHIQCATTVDCLTVQGYLQARDRLFPMDLLRHIARGKLTELVGAGGLAQDTQMRTLFTTRAGHRLEDDLAAVVDPTVAPLVTGFVAGVNAYLAQLRATPGAQLPGEYAQLPYPLTPADIDDWTAADTFALARLQQFQLSETLSDEVANGVFASVYGMTSGKTNAWIRAAAPATERAHTLSPTASQVARATPRARPRAIDLSGWKSVLRSTAAMTASLRARLRPADASVGSNNWVVSGAMSATGVAMVANDPHLSLQYPPLFHLSVMTSSNAADNLNLAGGAFPGIPGALVGRGAHVGWGVTVVGYDVTDVYAETLNTQSTGCSIQVPCVMFNGQPVAMQVYPQDFRTRIGPGHGASAFTDTPGAVYIVPHHGPVVSLSPTQTGGTAMSFRWTGHEGNTQDVKAIFGLNTAVDVDGAIAALKDFATGAQNFVLADDQGHIAYDPHALVPRRSFTEGESPVMPWFPLSGLGSAEWGDGSGCATATTTPVPASCWIADDQLPQGKDPAKGYYFTANADPTSPSVSDDNNPLGHPPYLSFAWDDSTGFRATRIEQMLAAAIAAHGKISLADMEAIQSDHVSRPGMVFTSFIAANVTPAPDSPPELALAKAVLQQWAAAGWDCPSGLLGDDPKLSPVDTTAGVVQSASGCFLFHEFLRTLLTNVFTDDLAVAGQPVNGLQALKAMIFMLTDSTADTSFCHDVSAQGTTATTCTQQVTNALVQAYDTLTSQVGPNQTDWVWGRYHTITPVSLLPLVTTSYAPGPYARPGGAFTVDVGSPALSGSGLDFSYGAGGNVRHISLMDPGAPVIKMQLPGPERDGPTVLAGPDLLGQWVKNTYFDFAFGNQITSAAVSSQTFKAQ